ncbi:hypothetical protein [Halospina denitrificans]|nr:hypothetical protein [Halospina denitrificans]
MEAETLLEPEESDWPLLVQERAVMGAFTALTWFRTVRVPKLFRAEDKRTQGGSVIVDSYYDVLIGDYLGKPAFNWLMPTNDPYFDAASAMVREDWNRLPKADVLVFLYLDEDTWMDFMKKRDRDFDRSAQLESHFEMQELMLQASRRAATEHHTKLLVIEQRSGSPEDTALRVRDRLEEFA